jgi:fatty acid synthase
MKDQYVIVNEIFMTGIRDLKTISPNKTLAELGMDSMTAVEIKQTLEREFELYLTPQEIRNLTFARLEELSASEQNTEAEEQSLEGTSHFFQGGNYLEI